MMYDQETNAYPKDYRFDVNTNNENIARRIHENNNEHNQLHNLYS